MITLKSIPYIFISVLLFACTDSASSGEHDAPTETKTVTLNSYKLSITADEFTESSSPFDKEDGKVKLDSAGWLVYDINFNYAGRYKVEFEASAIEENSLMWLEDYYQNPDGRTYNVTGSVALPTQEASGTFGVEGSPFNKGTHKMRVHLSEGKLAFEAIHFTLMKPHKASPETLTQSTDGAEWSLVWSDEFDGTEVDTTKWTYDFGDWGWGNNELQYYTDSRTENARVEEGSLIIEARKNDMGSPWTSARLTTRGKVDFLYGKIEFKAIVPREKGNWAAGWTLGDSYVDEKSWPYCGEIDIMESVGYEVDNESGDGIAHATVHTPAYYFKINNQISSVKDVKNIAGEFHSYAVEWTPTEIKGFVDGEEYYLYDKTANEKEWPFNEPQNIILNLAMGGGWGGAQGMDPNVESQKLIIDYVRVYELK